MSTNCLAGAAVAAGPEPGVDGGCNVGAKTSIGCFTVGAGLGV